MDSKLKGSRLWVIFCAAITTFAFTFIVSSASVQPAIAQSKADAHVKARLIADTTAIQPGKPFKLGIELTNEPGWHTYYKESGDAGMPTRVEWKLPDGFKASELLWQRPTKFNDEDIITYGYANRSVLGAVITAPAGLKPGQKLSFNAHVKWLACKEVCLPGEGDVSLTLPVSDAKTPAKPANSKDFASLGFDGPLSSIPMAGKDAKEAHDPIPVVANADDNGSSGTGGGGGSAGSRTLSFATGGGTGSADSVALANSQPAQSNSQPAQANSQPAPAAQPELIPPAKKVSVLDETLKVDDGQSESMGLLAYLGIAFIGGFILNFMPCVLPVISIKVLSLMQQAGDAPGRVFKLGLTFSAGIVAAFMVLAAIIVGVQQAGQKVGWGFQFQYPVFVLAMASIVLVLALSLFGVFYVQLSAGQQQLDKLANREGFVGTFFKGVLATTLSTPCTAPFLGTALGFAFAQPAWVIFAVFATIGLGMASPYLLLTAKPGWMSRLPKPGVWMEKFKEAMGFVLLATVVWLLSVLGHQVGPDLMASAIGFLVGLSFAVWMIGSFIDLTSTTTRKATVYAGAGAVVLGSYLGFLAPNPVLLSTQAPSPSAPVKMAANTQLGAEALWQPFSVDSLNTALSEGKTVFIDFTADWCLTCKVNENTVINTTPVLDRMKSLGVVPMKADWTSQDPEITKTIEKFGRSGVPLYVIFPGSRPTEPIVLPEVITQQLVLDKLNQAGASRG